MEDEESSLRRKFSSVWSLLDERSRRLIAASEALALGYGGVSRIRRASGLSRKAIAKGIREIADGNAMPGRIRRSGAAVVGGGGEGVMGEPAGPLSPQKKAGGGGGGEGGGARRGGGLFPGGG